MWHDALHLAAQPVRQSIRTVRGEGCARISFVSKLSFFDQFSLAITALSERFPETTIFVGSAHIELVLIAGFLCLEAMRPAITAAVIREGMRVQYE